MNKRMKTSEPKKMGELATLGILVATGWLTGCKAPPPSTAANAPKPVRVAEVAMTNVNFYLDSFGTLEAKRMVDLIPQVTGTVRAVLYQEGNRVTKDQVMYELDDRDYRENMVKAKAAFESSGASLRLAEDRLRRNEQLADKKMVSADTLESLKNSVAQARDSLTAAQAAVRQAELQIEYCTVRAPTESPGARSWIRGTLRSKARLG
jgi:multidrug efflux pump subunit AcrA (membrane-fusion protein)